jgi:hypothetical protein
MKTTKQKPVPELNTAREYQNEHEAAALLNCKVSTLRRWRLTGEGPEYCKIGRLVRYPLESLIAFANKHKVSSTTA